MTSPAGSVNAPKPICGIVMPISALDGCPESHWTDVREILEEALEDAGFQANLVSNADEVSVIQKRIIQNLYDNPIVVCDVSGRNSNVMFELGLRLAFDKPTIIIKDDKTPFSFDTAPVEHVEYPRDLRFAKIVEFKAKLIEKTRSTFDASSRDPKYSTFLRHFGEFTVAKLEKKELPSQQYILEELKNIQIAIDKLHRSQRFVPPAVGPSMLITLPGRSGTELDEARLFAETLPGVVRATVGRDETSVPRLILRTAGVSSEERQGIRLKFRERFPPIADRVASSDT